MQKATKKAVAKERATVKVTKVIKSKGYPSGKLPKDKELHHIKTVAEGGKTTNGNKRVVSVAKHKTIHKNRRKIGKI